MRIHFTLNCAKKYLQLRFTSVCLLRFYLRGFIGASARAQAEWSAGLGGWMG